MNNNIYIAIKRINDYSYPVRNRLEGPEWEYAGVDSAGYSCFCSLHHGAKSFNSINEAKEWYGKVSHYITQRPEDYDWSTLSLVKIDIVESLPLDV